MNFTKALSIAVTPVEIAVTLILGSFPAPYRNSRDSRDPGNHRLTMTDRLAARQSLRTPDVRSSNFLLAMKKSGRVFLLGGTVSHRRALGKPNKIVAFEVALMGDRRAFPHEHAMGAGMGVPTVGEAGRVFHRPDGDAGFRVFQETFGEQSPAHFGYEVLLPGHGVGVEDLKFRRTRGFSTDRSALLCPDCRTMPPAGSAARRVP